MHSTRLGIFHVLRGWSSLAVTPCLPRAKCNNAFVGTPQGGCWVWVHVWWTQKTVNQTKESALQIHPVDFEGAWNTKSVDPDHSQQQYWQHGKFLFVSCLYMFARSPACSALCVRAFYVDLFGAFSQSIRGSLDQNQSIYKQRSILQETLGSWKRIQTKNSLHTCKPIIYIYIYTWMFPKMAVPPNHPF